MPSSISIILASWFALLTRPLMMGLAKRIGGRTRSAAVTPEIVVAADPFTWAVSESTLPYVIPWHSTEVLRKIARVSTIRRNGTLC
ncbi:MAG TPA: hypothetical protein VF395_21930 [Polyangiaceae bacterium]